MPTQAFRGRVRHRIPPCESPCQSLPLPRPPPPCPQECESGYDHGGYTDTKCDLFVDAQSWRSDSTVFPCLSCRGWMSCRRSCRRDC